MYLDNVLIISFACDMINNFSKTGFFEAYIHCLVGRE